MKKPKVLLALKASLHDTMFSAADRRRLLETAEVMNPAPPEVIDRTFLLGNLRDADVVVSSWNTPAFDEEILARAERLRLITHAAGSVRPIVSPTVWSRGVRVTSAAAAISHGVAEYCVGLILLATKRAFWLGLETRAGHWKDAGVLHGGWHEIYQQKIGVIGAGFVGRRLVELLRNFNCTLLVYDPFVDAVGAEKMGAKKAETLDQLFSECMVVSLNAPTTPDTLGMLRGSHFAKLRRGGVFINTARSLLINEPELIAELKTGRFVACIDVTEPEPPPLDHPFRQLPNVWLTPHIAGAVAENRLRIGTMVVDEIAQHAQGLPYRHEVTEKILASMA